MYAEWCSLAPQMSANSLVAQSCSVLNKFPASAGRECVIIIVRQLATNLGMTQNAEPSHLIRDEEVNWCMDVICFGLSLPLQEHDTIKDCVNVYCEWLTSLHPQPRISVPKPICEDANMYCRKIINHFHNLFVPRSGECADTINRQAVLCHRVLRTLQQTAQISHTMDRQTWEALLLFLLAINEILLAPPTIKDDVGDHLCERVLSVLFEVWLLACVRCFPSPSLWRTLQESCAMWRHRQALIDQWNRVNLVLTARLLEFTHGPAFPELKIAEEDAYLIPVGMSNDCIAQTWYRFLHTIGNPSALCYPQTIIKSSHFVQWALTHDKGPETYQHPCLQALPHIFLKAIKGISNQVDAFLGICLPLLHQPDDILTNLLDIRLSLNEATNTSTSTTSLIGGVHTFFHHGNNNILNSLHSSSAYNPNQQHHHHYPHLHLQNAGHFLRDNFIGGSASSALSAIIGGSHHGSASSGSISGCGSSGGSSGSAVGNVSSNGSQSAGVVETISFNTTAVTTTKTATTNTTQFNGSMVTPNNNEMSGLLIALTTSNGIVTTTCSTSVAAQVSYTSTPPLQRRLAKSFSVTPTITQKGLNKSALIGLTSSRSSSAQAPLTPVSGPPSANSITSPLPSIGAEQRPPLAVARPKCNSILHLFGEWLFEAAHIGGDTWLMNTKRQANEASKRPSSMIMENRKGSISLSQPSSLNDSNTLQQVPTIDKYESGRAEAIGALCKIFCAKKTGEEILPVYLARFYMALQQCLKITEQHECDETLASILLNSGDLFRLDLDGLQVLLPSFIVALEIVLPNKNLKIKTQAIVFNKTELRRAAINILLSILSLPSHFQTLPVRELNADNSSDQRIVTFIQLKPRLINVLMNALQVETNAQNTHMLLGGLLLVVQNAVTFEDYELSHGQEHLHATSPLHGTIPHTPSTTIGGTHINVSDLHVLSSASSEHSASITSMGGASSLSGHSSATVGMTTATTVAASSQHDYPSLTVSDDLPIKLLHEFESGPFFDNAHALFVRATYLVCHRLISSWRTDLNVSLAALELLSGLARLHMRDFEALECKRAVKWICDYICYLCSRPPPAHSKDLHSTIVAAFQCTSVWLMQHPYLLHDKDCLQTVLEVVELGISGSKSVCKTSGEMPKYKDEKELKPASMRVRDAAEHLLTIILEQVGYFPRECGPESISSLLDEVALMKHCHNANYDCIVGSGAGNSSGNTTSSCVVNSVQAISKFKYFVTENCTILALLEEPLGNDQDPQPTVTMLIRGPFGRHAWTMQLRHLPRSKSRVTKHHTINPGRPIPMNDVPQRIEFDQKYFPEGVDKMTPCVADYSIPTMEQIREQYGTAQIRQLEELLESQSIQEKLAWAETDNSDILTHAQECVPPKVYHEFQAARLFLAHFGFLNIEQNNPNSLAEVLGVPIQQPLIVLDTKRSNFAGELNALDKLSARTYDTVHVFYVRAGQSNATDIVANVSHEESLSSLHPHFGHMLLTLGWPVDVTEHCGWTGFMSTSWLLKQTPTAAERDATMRINGLKELKFNGERRVLYWADVSSEMAFVVPTMWNLRSEGSLCNSNSTGDANLWLLSKNSGGSEANKQQTQKFRNLSLEVDPKTKEPVPPTRRKTNPMKPTLLAQSPSKIFLVWLESFEDHLNFPIDDLLAYTRTGEENPAQMPRASDCHVIFLHALQSGLLRVKLQGPTGRMSFATPLVDGMVLSHHVVGNLVRQTAHNVAKRRRLDNDNFQPPHVRRRLKVQDIVQKFKMDLTEPELLTHLFKSTV